MFRDKRAKGKIKKRSEYGFSLQIIAKMFFEIITTYMLVLMGHMLCQSLTTQLQIFVF